MMAGVTDDKAPSVLLNIRKENYDEHYLAGNEEHMELFVPAFKDRGGVYAGVGTDQAYFFIGWMKPKFAFFTDYDPWVKRMHQIYAVAFKHATNPDDFRRLFSKRKRPEMLALLKAAGLPLSTINIYKWGRYLVARRLIIQRKYFLRKHPTVPTFLTDQTTYDYVRTMIVQGRTKPMIGNLLDTVGMQSVGIFCRLTGQKLRALYFSNAEQYWKKYTDEFKANIRQFPIDDESVIVRTLASQPQNGGFRYVVQPFKNFRAFLDHDWAKRVSRVVPRVKLRRGEFKLERLNTPPLEHYAQWKSRRDERKKRRAGK